MKIMITPHEIIERALWDDYQYYVLKNGTDIESLIEENKEFEISEKSALVIGLSKCIETDNLVHRCNQYIEHLISVKCTKYQDTFYIKKRILVDSLVKFDKKFPKTWKPTPNYKESLKDVKKYVKELFKKIDKLATLEITDNFGTHELIRTNHVKKILDYHNQ